MRESFGTSFSPTSERMWDLKTKTSKKKAVKAPRSTANRPRKRVTAGEAVVTDSSQSIDKAADRPGSGTDAVFKEQVSAVERIPSTTPSSASSSQISDEASVEAGSRMKLPETLAPKKKVEQIYVYTDEEGKPLYECVRFKPKTFMPRHRDSQGRYVWNLNGVRRVPYRLHDFANSEGQTVFVVEGEKDVETARRIGLIATCSQGGANGWKPSFAEYLHKHTVVIIPDNDEPGEQYAEVVADSVRDLAQDWRIVRLPNLPAKGDLTDFVDAGGSRADIMRMVAEAFSKPREEMIPLPSGNKTPTPHRNGKSVQSADPKWSIVSRCFADIERVDIDWLWAPIWVNNSLNLLIGKGGVGKTHVVAHLAAAVSRGMPFPDDGGVAPLGDVVYCTTEDSLGAVIRPRLEEAGADINRVFTWTAKTTTDRSDEQVEKELSLHDIDLMTEQIEKMPNLKLIIFDPVTAYLGDGNANENKEVRPLLEKLLRMSERKKVCVLIVSHLKKGQAQAIDSTLGAQAFIAVPRSVYMLQKDPESDDKNARCLSPVKTNNGPDTAGKKLTLVYPHGLKGPGHIVWDAVPDERTADEISGAMILKNCAKGRDVHEEKSETKSELKFFDVLDSLSQPDGTWVPTKKIRDILNWNGSRMTNLLWNLERSERIEVRDGQKEMPGGGVQKGGREEVRRRQHQPEWSPVQ